MEVEINLLPRKKKSINTNRKLYILLLVVFLVGSIGIVTTEYFAMMEISRLEEEAESLKKLRLKVENELNGTSPAQQEESIRKEINEVISNRVITSEVVDQVMQQLPERAMTLNISYKNDGAVKVLGQFEQMSDVAKYQSQLLNATGIEKVILVKLIRNDEQLKADQETSNQTHYFADLSITFDRGMFFDGGGLK
ncbi:hypothetical protein [Alkalihalobacillus sp. AL-G]|uniref:hypothetical protein n=1 Tax=Alkalihalobacillus sp. AL-G TaxID=2926399 RepID=UPI0027295296|nr:hypothetical protein [Alkalihalobacillus sp. AL-G]WLD92245.1 hypothetical protein MOJ78_14615 [Alkalihalobacillus sp. AL-G]